MYTLDKYWHMKQYFANKIFSRTYHIRGDDLILLSEDKVGKFPSVHLIKLCSGMVDDW